jgi:hypothetical protein
MATITTKLRWIRLERSYLLGPIGGDADRADRIHSIADPKLEAG